MQNPHRGSQCCVWKQGLIALLTIWLFAFTQSYAQENTRDSLHFTEDHPVIFEDAWDLWPYSFLEDGQPTGYSVDLVRMIFEELKLPYEIKLKDSRKALEDLESGKSDVMMGMKAPFHDSYGQYGKIALNLFTHSVVYVKGKPQPIFTIEDLAKQRVIVRNNSFSHHLMLDRGWGENAIPFNDMKEAVLQVSTEGEGVILWNTMSLKWLINQYHADNLEMKPVDIPHGEYRFFSKNTQLLALMDSTYAVLRAQDRMQELQNKWFYPERKDTGIPSWIWTVVYILIIFLCCILGYYLFYSIRDRRMTRHIRRENARLALTLKASAVRIWTYDIRQQTITWLDNDGNKKHEYTLLQLFSNYTSQDLEKMMQALNQLADEKAESKELHIRTAAEPGGDMREYIISLSVFHRDKFGKPTVIIGTHHDISEDRKRQDRVKDTLIRYQAIFDSIMVDMVYFDQKGNLVDLNDKACHTFGVERSEFLSKNVNILELYGLQKDDVLQDLFIPFYATIRLDLPFGKKPERTVWYELKIQPLYDRQEDGLQGVYGTGREVTELSTFYHMRQEGIQQLNKASKEVRRYIDNINFALKVGGMQFVIYRPDTHIISIYSNITDVQQQLTQSRAIKLIDEQSKMEALNILMSMDNHTATHIDVTLRTILKQSDGHARYMQLLLIPSSANNSNEYFGICRDVSELKNTEKQLEKETTKAQEIETIKNAFLHNMNYEIRTPLNSIVGFAEFFQMPHTPDDEKVFVDEIKNNASSLLRLINNILFLSRIDAKMIEINTKPADFALAFDSMCHTFWDNNLEKAKVELVVENNYRHMVLDIDIQNIGHILEQIIINAMQFTEKGSIHTRYDYTGDQLFVAVEDTGCGIPPELTDHIFERFSTGASNGTGLGLSICHELIRLMNGHINIKSIEGQGTTVWFSIPCKAKEIERKSLRSL